MLVLLFTIFIPSCTPGVRPTLPPDLTLSPGTDIPQQMATVTPDIFTQTSEPVISSPVLGVTASPPTPNEYKPADSDTPASGICGEAQSESVIIILGTDPSGMPLAGRCIAIDPAQHIKLVNQSGNPLNTNFAGYQINLLAGGEMLLDKPVGQFLALGVHFLPMGPELWVKESAVATALPPIVEYNNSTMGYKLNLPGNWSIDENDMTNGLSKEVTFYPPNPEPFIAYLSVSLNYRSLDQVINLNEQNVPDATREDTLFNGYPGIRYTYRHQNSVYRIEYYIPFGGQLFLIATDRPNDSMVQSILMTIRFTSPPSPTTYEATLVDNGRTIFMNIGDKLKLNLDLRYIWSVASISDPAVIAGAQDGYFAFTNGAATLSTIGHPECLSSTPPCAMPSITFAITVIVQ